MNQSHNITKRMQAIGAVVITVLFCTAAWVPQAAGAADRPNILWIYVEDMNGWLGCYGEKLITTPHVDALAKRGVRFTRAYTPAGVCSATRSGIITGTMQTTFGIHNHRSSRDNSRGKAKDVGMIHLPEHVKTIPEHFNAAGYYTFNQGKTDYNFVYDVNKLYSYANKTMGFQGGKEWAGRSKGQPFFGQIQLKGGKNKGAVANKTDPAKVTVMPYYPDHPIVRREIAFHYDCVKQTDNEVGQIIAALKRDGLYDNTIVVFFTDHGFRMIRHKQFLYEGGINVPMVIAGPGVAQGKVRDDLVSGIDLSVTSLAWAGIDIPKYVEGRDFFADDYKPREFVIAARDRCDYTIEHIRAVVTPRYKYLRNFLTDRPYLQPQYRDGRDYMQILKTLYKDGKLNAIQSAFVGPDRPAEELYDLTNDPHETINLANDANHAAALKTHCAILAKWMKDTDDQGQYPEPVDGLYQAMLRWRGKCVNSEYQAVIKKYGDLGPAPAPEKKNKNRKKKPQ